MNFLNSFCKLWLTKRCGAGNRRGEVREQPRETRVWQDTTPLVTGEGTRSGARWLNKSPCRWRGEVREKTRETRGYKKQHRSSNFRIYEYNATDAEVMFMRGSNRRRKNCNVHIILAGAAFFTALMCLVIFSAKCFLLFIAAALIALGIFLLNCK